MQGAIARLLGLEYVRPESPESILLIGEVGPSDDSAPIAEPTVVVTHTPLVPYWYAESFVSRGALDPGGGILTPLEDDRGNSGARGLRSSRFECCHPHPVASRGRILADGRRGRHREGCRAARPGPIPRSLAPSFAQVVGAIDPSDRQPPSAPGALLDRSR